MPLVTKEKGDQFEHQFVLEEHSDKSVSLLAKIVVKNEIRAGVVEERYIVVRDNGIAIVAEKDAKAGGQK